MKNWLFLYIAIVSEVVATSALKQSDGFSKLRPSCIVVVGYAMALVPCFNYPNYSNWRFLCRMVWGWGGADHIGRLLHL